MVKRSDPAIQRTPPMLGGRLPVLGHVVEFTRDREALFRRGHAELGDVFGIDLAGHRAAVVTGAEHDKTFYQATDRSLNISDGYAALEAAFGEVLFIADRETYTNQRPVLKALFSKQRMVGFVEAMNAEVQRWLDGLGDRSEIDITREMLTVTQNVAAHAFFGPRFRDELDGAFWDDYAALAGSIDLILPPHLPLPRFIRRDRAKKRIRSVVSRMIDRRRRDPGRYADPIVELLDTPQRDGTTMSDADITSLLVGLLFAGHETTAGQAAWTLIATSDHPEVLARAREEVEANVGDDLVIDAATLRRLEYVYRVIDETTRLYPSADTQVRTVEQDTAFGDFVVPAGWRVFVNAANTHHLADKYTDPERFDPSRFERGEGVGPWDSVGFGGGLHQCTGMSFAKNEMAVILARVLRQLEIERVTPETHVVRNQGANRPSPTILRLTRRPR